MILTTLKLKKIWFRLWSNAMIAFRTKKQNSNLELDFAMYTRHVCLSNALASVNTSSNPKLVEHSWASRGANCRETLLFFYFNIYFLVDFENVISQLFLLHKWFWYHCL